MRAFLSRDGTVSEPLTWRPRSGHAPSRHRALPTWRTSQTTALHRVQSVTASATLAGNRVTCANTYTNRKNRCNVTFDGSPGSNRVLSAASSVFRKLSGCPPDRRTRCEQSETRARRVMRLDPAGILLPNGSRRAVRARYPPGRSVRARAPVRRGCAGSGGAGGSVSGTITIAAVPGVDNAPSTWPRKKGCSPPLGLTCRDQDLLEPGRRAERAAERPGRHRGQRLRQHLLQQAQSHDLRILADGYDAGAASSRCSPCPGSTDQVAAGPGEPDRSACPATACCVEPARRSGSPISLDAAAATQVLRNYLGNQAESVHVGADAAAAGNHRARAAQAARRSWSASRTSTRPRARLGAVEVLDACSGSTASLPLPATWR